MSIREGRCEITQSTLVINLVIVTAYSKKVFIKCVHKCSLGWGFKIKKMSGRQKSLDSTRFIETNAKKNYKKELISHIGLNLTNSQNKV